MPEVHCFTSASFSYLDRARVLAETVKHFHPDWTLWLCLSDREPDGFAFEIEKEKFDRLVRIEELNIPDLERWIFVHDVVELCTAVKGAMLCKILESGADKVLYLDPDIALFGDLSLIPELLDHHAVVLTPHLLAPEPTLDGVQDNEIGSLKHGVYNLGFIAIRNSPEGRQCARWWRDRLIDFCFDDIPNGLFTDQRWCDLIPAFFPTTHILSDPGYNVACWNLSNRPINFRPNGEIWAAESLLRFFHFTKVNSVGEKVLEKYANGRSEVFELLHWYRQKLAANKAKLLPSGWWAFGNYQNGKSILREHRLIYRKRTDLQSLLPRPFDSGPNTFQAWCTENLTT
jgi:hypothetical protein